MPAAAQISQLEKFVRRFAALSPAQAEATLVSLLILHIFKLKRTQFQCCIPCFVLVDRLVFSANQKIKIKKSFVIPTGGILSTA
jgi:hypothetical protein